MCAKHSIPLAKRICPPMAWSSSLKGSSLTQPTTQSTSASPANRLATHRSWQLAPQNLAPSVRGRRHVDIDTLHRAPLAGFDLCPGLPELWEVAHGVGSSPRNAPRARLFHHAVGFFQTGANGFLAVDGPDSRPRCSHHCVRIGSCGQDGRGNVDLFSGEAFRRTCCSS